MRYLDVCSGYSAFTVANRGLGFECAGYSEIEAFPRAILEQRHGAVAVDWDHRHVPGSNVTPLFGDFTKIEAHHVRPVQLLVGGTPCQAFSVAGKRLGLDDPRGNLTLEFLALARRLCVEWLVWENVPGFLSHDGGRTMGTFLRLLGQLGYGFAYRVLDAQYVRVDGHERAVPQRRRRLFVVGHLGDAAGPASVLFERESLRGDSAPRRQAGQGSSHAIAPSLVSSGRGVERTGETRGQDPVVAVARGFGGGNRSGSIDAAACLTAKGQRCDFEVETFIADVAGTMPARSSRGGGQTNSPGHNADQMLVAHSIAATLTKGGDRKEGKGYSGRRDEDDKNLVAMPVYAINSDALDRSGEGAAGNAAERAGLGIQADVGYSLPSKRPDAVAFQTSGNCGAWETGPIIGALDTGTDPNSHIVAEAENSPVTQAWAVRRLTPTECERLMGVPDGFTAITYRNKPAADGPRYKALGNSQAVNVMRWIAHGLADAVAAQAQKDLAA